MLKGARGTIRGGEGIKSTIWAGCCVGLHVTFFFSFFHWTAYATVRAGYGRASGCGVLLMIPVVHTGMPEVGWDMEFLRIVRFQVY